MKAAGSKFVNQVLMSKRGGRHDIKQGHKNAKRSKQKAEMRRQLKDM